MTQKLGNKHKTPKISSDEFAKLFYERVLMQYAYQYQESENPSIEFPNIENSKELPEEKKIEFKSRIADLRLRRAQNNQGSQNADINSKIAKSIEELENKLTTDVIIDDAFRAEPIHRSKTPLYLRNKRKDLQILNAKSKHGNHIPLDMKQIEMTYTSRLKKSEKEGIERANNRSAKMKRHAKEQKELNSTKTLRK